jgi:hypothetical protein
MPPVSEKFWQLVILLGLIGGVALYSYRKPFLETKSLVKEEAKRVIKVDEYILGKEQVLPQLDSWGTPLSYSFEVSEGLITATVRSYGRDKTFSNDDIKGVAFDVNHSKKFGKVIEKSIKEATIGFFEGIKEKKFGDMSNE